VIYIAERLAACLALVTKVRPSFVLICMCPWADKRNFSYVNVCWQFTGIFVAF